MVVRERFSYRAIHGVLSGLLEQDLHAKRVNSLCDATLGVLHSGSLAIRTCRPSKRVSVKPSKRSLYRASCVRKAQGFELAAQCFADGVRYWLHGDAE